jgi:hypothetical protein
LVARLLWEQDAVGSNPVTPIFLLQKNAEIVHDNDLGVLFLAIDPNRSEWTVYPQKLDRNNFFAITQS